MKRLVLLLVVLLATLAKAEDEVDPKEEPETSSFDEPATENSDSEPATDDQRVEDELDTEEIPTQNDEEPQEGDDDMSKQLHVEMLVTPENCDRKAGDGDAIRIHYNSSLEDGTKIDSSHDYQDAYGFQMGSGEAVLPGLEQGLWDMCVGERRRITIPPQMAYGDEGDGKKIPPKATIIFEVEMLSVEDGEPPRNLFAEIDTNENGQLERPEIDAYFEDLVKKEGGEPNEAHKNKVQEIVDAEDTDQDGIISFDEFTGPKPSVNPYDNKDGDDEDDEKRDEL